MAKRICTILTYSGGNHSDTLGPALLAVLGEVEGVEKLQMGQM